MAQVHGNFEEKNHEFLRHLYSSIRDYHGQLPNLRDIFRPEAIEWLLTESVKNDRRSPELFIDFVFNSGYKDEPEVGEDGKPLSRRTTPIHYANRNYSKSYFVDNLFKIYDKFDVNYTDEDGLTHFHAACQNGCDDVVEKFLDLGQDPNLLVTKTRESPLYLALSNSNEEVFKLLLRRGADPNLVGHSGHTILHDLIIYQKYHDDDFLDIFFKITKEVDQVVEVDVRNDWDLTPLELAVVNFFPDVIDVLLDHGADLSDFFFPSEDDFDEKLEIDDIDSYFLVILASGILAVVELLEKRGYEFDRSDAMTIMKVFTKYGWPGKSENIDDGWFDDEEFAVKAKEFMVIPSLSLYDLIRLRPEEAAKLVTYEDYYKFAQSWVMLSFDSVDQEENCCRHLHEKLTKRFFRRWALDPFMDLTRQHLPILCCEMIIQQLKNEDLWHVCLAATGQNIH